MRNEDLNVPSGHGNMSSLVTLALTIVVQQWGWKGDCGQLQSK